jgi:hypothetical protein
LEFNQSQTDSRAFTPKEMTQWQDYVRGEVDVNRNVIYFWEIWGEPSFHKYGSPEEFVQLLRERGIFRSMWHLRLPQFRLLAGETAEQNYLYP